MQPDEERLLRAVAREVDAEGGRRDDRERDACDEQPPRVEPEDSRPPRLDEEEREEEDTDEEDRNARESPQLRADEARRRPERVPLERVPEDEARPVAQVLGHPEAGGRHGAGAGAFSMALQSSIVDGKR